MFFEASQSINSQMGDDSLTVITFNLYFCKSLQSRQKTHILHELFGRFGLYVEIRTYSCISTQEKKRGCLLLSSVLASNSLIPKKILKMFLRQTVLGKSENKQSEMCHFRGKKINFCSYFFFKKVKLYATLLSPNELSKVGLKLKSK